jgi:hypothetical protein
MTEISKETRTIVKNISLARAYRLNTFLPSYLQLLGLAPHLAKALEEQTLHHLEMDLPDALTYEGGVEIILKHPRILQEPEVVFMLQLLELEKAVKDSGVETQEVISDATCSPNHN